MKKALLALIPCLGLLAGGSLQAALVTLNADAEVGIRDDIPTINQNGTGTVIVGNTANASGRTLNGLVRFDTSSIIVTGGFEIDVTSVILNTVNASSAGGGTPTIQIREYGFEFLEASATWNNPAGNGSDATAGGTLGTVLSSSSIDTAANATNSFASSAAFISVVEAAINGDDTVNLLLARNTFSDSNTFTRFLESSSGFQLDITYDLVPVPEPSSFALLAGCFGLAWVMVRRRA